MANTQLADSIAHSITVELDSIRATFALAVAQNDQRALVQVACRSAALQDQIWDLIQALPVEWLADLL